jgi:hypothetical protein
MKVGHPPGFIPVLHPGQLQVSPKPFNPGEARENLLLGYARVFQIAKRSYHILMQSHCHRFAVFRGRGANLDEWHDGI